MSMAAAEQLARAVARFQHSNESMHRHPNVGKASCNYCDLVGHYAVRTMRANPELAVAVLRDTLGQPGAATAAAKHVDDAARATEQNDLGAEVESLWAALEQLGYAMPNLEPVVVFA